MKVATKVAIARAITRPQVGRLVGRLTGNSIVIRGARINIASPLIQDTTRAQLAFGLYERAELRFVSEHLRSDLDLVELGSSIGVVGSVALRKLASGRRLIAVEADRTLASIAQHNFRQNAGATGWTLDAVAISYGMQEGLNFVTGDSTVAGRLAPNGPVGHDNIERCTLSDLLASHEVDRYALIADIEGAEAGIINDDAAALARCDQMIIELHDTDEMRVSDMRSALIERHAFSVTAERGPVLVLER